MAGLRALWGGPLVGDRLVRVIYLDASGLANQKHEPYVVIAGVIVDPDKEWKSINQYLSDMADEYVGKSRRFDFYFHAMELFHGTRSFPREKYSKETRWKILDEILAIPSKFGSPIVWGYADRRWYVSGQAGMPKGVTPLTAAQAVAYTISAVSAEHWMNAVADPDEMAMLVMENDDQSRQLIKRTHRIISDPKLRAFMQEGANADITVTRLIYPVHFEEKTDSSALQIADACAFAIKRFLMGSAEQARFYEPLKPYLVNQLKVSEDGKAQLLVPIK
jgi:hypothetical protein